MIRYHPARSAETNSRKDRMRKTLLGVAAVLVTGLCRCAAADPMPSDRIVVMVSIDGLAGFYLDDPQAEMPTLREMAKQGVRAIAMKASTPTLTWPNHATLVTGDTPARHGVTGNNVYDRASGQKVTLISDPTWDADKILKVPTLYDVAKTAGLKTAAIRWPVTRGSKTLDVVMPDMSDDAVLKGLTTPSLVDRGTQAGFFTDTDFVPADPDKHPQVKDTTATDLFDLVLHEDKPQFALLHLIEVDHTEHESGPRSDKAYAAVKDADARLKQVWDELKRDYPDRATLVVVSDHGFSLNRHQILSNVVLRDAGLVKVVGIRQVEGDVVNVLGGGADLIYVKDPAKRDETVAKIKQAFANVPGIRKILTRENCAAYGVADPAVDPHAPDVMLLADEGYYFGDSSNGAIPVVDKPERRGTHGHDPEIPDLKATFVAWGVGIRPGTVLGEVRNTDVAPTLAKLLGITLPDTDGEPLLEALQR